MKLALVCLVLIYSVNGIPLLMDLMNNGTGRYQQLLLSFPIPKNVKLPEALWFTQKLSHFNGAETRGWEQRYFVNDEFYKPGGPVFLMIGGEGPASPTLMVTGSWINYAKKHKALCVQLEHRFYGESRPTSDLSVENLKYLNSEQALADLAYFRQSMTEKYSLGKAKWIAFGISYAGSLAAWLRYKYPHLFHAAVSSSAPMFAVSNFKEYFGVVGKSLGSKCSSNIAQATRDIEKLMEDDAGRKKLKDLFNLCNPITNDTNPYDAKFISLWLAFDLAVIVQHNKILKGLPSIDQVCRIMSDEKLGDQLQRYVALYNFLRAIYGNSQACFQGLSYKKQIEIFRMTEYGMFYRQWLYQKCTEFGFFHTFDLKTQPFGQLVSEEYYVQRCIDTFGPQFNSTTINSGIKETNINYGGYKPKLTRVIFLNGAIDPWHALGITKSLKIGVPAIYIRGASHGADALPDSPNDSFQLKFARKITNWLIEYWLLLKNT